MNYKRLLLFGFLSLILLRVTGQNSPLAGTLIMKGNIAGLTTGTVTVTAEVFNNQKQTFTAPIAQGKFQLTINQPSPTLYSLVVKEDPSGYVIFFAENGTINLMAEKGKLQSAVLNGSVANTEWNQFNTMSESYTAQIENIKEVYQKLGEEGKLLPKQDSLERVFGEAVQKKDYEIKTWIATHPKSFVSPLAMILSYGNEGDPAVMRMLFNNFSDDVKKSYYGNFIETILVRKEGLSVGKAAPMFSQNDTQGKPISLEAYKGKYVLVDFWASWCGPCRQENPNVVRTYQKYKGQNFEILGVSLDSNKDKWLQAIKEDQLTWAHVSDLKGWRNDVAVQYGVQSIPANFLLDKEGKIIAKGLRGEQLVQVLEQVLNLK